MIEHGCFLAQINSSFGRFENCIWLIGHEQTPLTQYVFPRLSVIISGRTQKNITQHKPHPIAKLLWTAKLLVEEG